MSSLQAPRGTFDVLPPDAARRAVLEEHARRILGAAGYGRIETPTFESTELFARGVGEATDIVQKEMYSFDDGGGRSLTLRPEGTAPVARAYLEHGMHKQPQPVKLWYLSTFFRAEAPQRGRYRQFWQVGAEAIGAAGPETDAELIVLLSDLLHAVGVKELHLRLSSLGTAETRREYREELAAYLHAHEDGLSPEVMARIDLNPMRAFDADDRRTQETMREAPLLLDRLAPEDAEHFERVKELLDEAGVSYALDATLVRGLDYYARTLWEFTSDALGAQSAVGGGGRYDGLIEQLGGAPTPGVGWAAGVERMLLAAAEQPVAADIVDLYVAIAARDSVPAHQAGLQARQRRAPGRPVRAAGAGRPQAQGPAQARGPPRCALRCDHRRPDADQPEGHGGGRPDRGRALGGDPGDPARGPRRVNHAPRANTFRDSWAGELDAERAGTGARVSGWVHRRRDHGGLIFIDLRERSGIVQLVFNPATAGAAHAEAHKLRSEDVITAAGTVNKRAPENVNPNLATGEIEIAVTDMEILADAETPPFPVDEDGAVDENLRLRYRSLDLRRAPMQDALALRHRVIKIIRDVLDDRDFLEIETPFLTRSTPEGARDFLVPARIAAGSFYALPQSPQLFKQLLMIGGFERYYQIVRCFRDEDARADRLPEFTQLDIEMAFVDEEDVLETSEAAIGAVFAQAGFDVPAPPWPRMTHAEAMGRFGSDRPDTRFGLELKDLGDAVSSSEFKVFSGRAGLRRRRARDQRRGPRADPLRPRRAHRTGQAARGQGPGVGVRAGRGRRGRRAVALADRQVPHPSGDRRRSPRRSNATPGDVLFIVADAGGHRQPGPRRAPARDGAAL